MHRMIFLLLAVIQIALAFRLLRRPQAAKDVNIQLNTTWARLPLWFYRGIGVLFSCAAVWCFYMFLYWPKSH